MGSKCCRRRDDMETAAEAKPKASAPVAVLQQQRRPKPKLTRNRSFSCPSLANAIANNNNNNAHVAVNHIVVAKKSLLVKLRGAVIGRDVTNVANGFDRSNKTDLL
jgi:hypothetical protein